MANHNGRFFLLVLMTGVLAGVTGVALVDILHLLEQLAFGVHEPFLPMPVTFLQSVSSASPIRRLCVLTGCGFVAGGGWYALYRWGSPLVSIQKSLKNHQPMPLISTMIHALLQVMIVAFGAPLGREVAPREISAAIAIHMAHRWDLTPAQIKMLTACAAGAGLAAVYNVPFGSVCFIAEVLLHTWSWRALGPALCTCGIATWISWIGLGRYYQYHIADTVVPYSLLIWAVVMGPVFGWIAKWFKYHVEMASMKAPRDIRVFVFCLINFSCIGLCSIYFPGLLGNGKGPIQMGFDNAMPIYLAWVLCLLRMLATWSSFRSGAHGGLLTPSIACGTLLAIGLGQLWNYFFLPLSSSSCALLGATAFLAAGQKMPVTAIVLMLELTGVDHHFILPMVLIVASAIFFSKTPDELI